MHNITLVVAASLLVAGVASRAHADDAVFESGPARVSLLELYTSEGCSSCPPADRWLSSLTDNQRLWKSVVPVAFHVDYWDYIGWKDRFADARFSQRQKRYASEGGVRVVYTPGFLLDGKEWRTGGKLRGNDRDDAGRLQLQVSDNGTQVMYTPAAQTDQALTANVAWLGFGLGSDVKAGENRGRRLQHDFVVLDYQAVPLERHGQQYSVILEALPGKLSAPRIGVAGWVSSGLRLAPLQATGGYLPKAN